MAATPNSKAKRIVIVGGGGTFGLSTAWYLAKAGYKNIVCLDRWPVPSLSSAGNDLNKIVRTEYSSSVYTRLAHEAVELWKDPMFAPAFYRTGWIYGTDNSTEMGRVQAWESAVNNTKFYGNAKGMVDLPDWDSAIARFPFLRKPGKVYGSAAAPIRAIYNSNAGWCDPVKAMRIIGNACEALGVRFVGGPEGTVVRLLREGPAGKIVSGVCTQDGRHWQADLVILAAGSYSDTLLDFQGQLEATAYVVTHIKMTEEQYSRYKDMPVLNISRRGYAFPPNKDRIFKAVNTDVSYIVSQNPGARPTVNGWGSLSIPRDPAYHPTDTQPVHAEVMTRQFLEYILPEFADAPIHSSRLCWDAEVFDYNWILCLHPSSPDSLIIATGGSGHSFKNITNMGKYALQLIEGNLDDELKHMWRWRPEAIGSSQSAEERARRPKLELEEAEGWNHEVYHEGSRRSRMKFLKLAAESRL